MVTLENYVIGIFAKSRNLHVVTDLDIGAVCARLEQEGVPLVREVPSLSVGEAAGEVGDAGSDGRSGTGGTGPQCDLRAAIGPTLSQVYSVTCSRGSPGAAT